MDDSRRTMTAKEVAEYLGISYWSITMLVKQKKIPHIRLNRRILFTKERIDYYLEQLQKESIARCK